MTSNKKNKAREKSWTWVLFLLDLNGEGTLGTIGLQVDFHLRSVATGCHQSVTQFLQSIAAVGDQLPDKNLVASEADHKMIMDQSN